MSSSAPLQTGGTPAPEMLRQYVERIERLEEEKQALMADIREVYAEAKAHGLNPKIMRQVVSFCSLDKQDLMELDAELETYRAALDMI